MQIDDLTQLREQHPAWRLLRATHAPLVLSFLGDFFIERNHGATPASTLIDALDDHLYAIHRDAEGHYRHDAAKYLDDWAEPEKGWLRKFYPLDSEEVHFDATPAVEQAYSWVQSLTNRAFIGTESRLHTLIELLRQIVHGSETDPATRIAELHRRRDAIDEEIRQVEANEISMLDESAVRDRYQQFSSTARELLSDFRQVEENFRGLDRSARERIATWDGSKGELLDALVTSRTDITASDQGRSFQAFYDFLLSEHRQQELADLLMAVENIPAAHADRRLRLIHHDWADAAERTQQTVRNLSEQLRRFLEDQVWLENRRVLDLVRAVEHAAIAVRDRPPGSADRVGLVIDEPGLPIDLPFERPLYDPQPESKVDSLLSPEVVTDISYDALLDQRFIDASRLADNVRAIVPSGRAALLTDILDMYPVEEGIAEILGYLTLTDDDLEIRIDHDETATVSYLDPTGTRRKATMRRVTVARR